MVTRQRVNFTLDTMYSKGVKNYLWKLREFTKMFDEPEMRTRINYFIGSEINRFVPKESGQLRASMEVYPDKITWGVKKGKKLDYAQYQFGGIVYAPNYPIMSKNKIIGWYSKPGMKKHPTDRELGVPGEWKGWRFGYTTPNTQHHWTDVYQGKLKSDTNKRITKYLKDECRMRGLNV